MAVSNVGSGVIVFPYTQDTYSDPYQPFHIDLHNYPTHEMESLTGTHHSEKHRLLLEYESGLIAQCNLSRKKARPSLYFIQHLLHLPPRGTPLPMELFSLERNGHENLTWKYRG